jgi:hypothetical protein
MRQACAPSTARWAHRAARLLEHFMPLARYALIADGEQMYPGSMYGQPFAEKTEVSIRQHAL